MQAAALVIIKAFLDPDDADMEILLEPDLFILHQGYPQAAGGNVQQHQAFVTGNMLVPHSLTDSHILCINFHGHFRHGHIQPGPQFDLVQHEHFVAGFPYCRSGLGRIHIRAVFLHQLLEPLQYLADFLYHGKGNAFILKSLFPQTNRVLALLYDLDPAQAAVLHDPQAQHLRAQVDCRQRCISFAFHNLLRNFYNVFTVYLHIVII